MGRERYHIVGTFTYAVMIASIASMLGCDQGQQDAIRNGASGSASGTIVGTWEATSGSSIQITNDGKWIGRAGPMQINLTYRVENAEGNEVSIALQEPGQPQDGGAPATLTVSNGMLTVSGNEMWGGTYVRK